MAPRTYTQDKRAEGARHTRERILDATLDLYIERGVADTTLKSVAEKADVSRGTILHHFGSADGLLGEALDHLLERLELPGEGILDGVEGMEARVRVFVDAMIDFQERSTPWWQTFESEMQRPILQEREATYWAWFERLMVIALGPELAADPRAGAVITALSHPATAGTFLWSFDRAGRTREEARAFIGDLAVQSVQLLSRGNGKGGQT